MEPCFVGIDVSKDRLDVHLRPSGEAFAVARDGKGLEELIARLRGRACQLVVLEATGGFETTVAAAVAAAGLPLAVVNPRQIRQFAGAIGQTAKTDTLDAEVNARFAEQIHPPARPIASEAAQALSELVARRRQLIEMMVGERNRRRQLTQRRLIKGADRLLAALQKELSALEHDIDDQIRGSPVWREKEDLLASVPGVGQIVARTLIAELPELGTIGPKSIAALAGLAPINHDSGKMRGQRRIRFGRASVRSALYMAALTAIRCNPTFKAFAHRLRAKGKRPKVVIIAVARKLLTALNAILRTNQPWRLA
jgi:transposase